MWLFVHLAFMTGFKNRFMTVLRLGDPFIGRARGERTLTTQQAIAQGRDPGGSGQPFLLSLATDAPSDRG